MPESFNLLTIQLETTNKSCNYNRNKRTNDTQADESNKGAPVNIIRLGKGKVKHTHTHTHKGRDSTIRHAGEQGTWDLDKGMC